MEQGLSKQAVVTLTTARHKALKAVTLKCHLGPWKHMIYFRSTSDYLKHYPWAWIDTDVLKLLESTEMEQAKNLSLAVIIP